MNRRFQFVLLFAGLGNAIHGAEAGRPLIQEMQQQLQSFKDIVHGYQGEGRSPSTAQGINYKDRLQGLEFFSQHVKSEAQNAYWAEDHAQVSGEKRALKQLLVDQFKYFLPLYEAELAVETSGTQKVDLVSLEYRTRLKDILVEAARLDPQQAQNYMAARRLSDASGIAARAEQEIQQALCEGSKGCSSVPGDLVGSLDRQPLAAIENAGVENSNGEALVSVDEARNWALGIGERSVSGSADEE